MGIPKNRNKQLFLWEPFDNLEDRRKRVAVSALPDRQNPVIVRFVTRSELAANESRGQVFDYSCNK